VRVIEHWKRLTREFVDSQPDMALRNLLWLTLLCVGSWTR